MSLRERLEDLLSAPVQTEGKTDAREEGSRVERPFRLDRPAQPDPSSQPDRPAQQGRPTRPARRRFTRTDPRITAKTFTWRNYALVFLASAFFYSGFATVYIAQLEDSPTVISLFLTELGYVVFFSLFTCLATAAFRHHFLTRPIQRACEAARRVAAGDYSVRLEPARKDGLKDEFELLADDLNTMAEELASTEMLKDDFVSTVSHELKTPLAVIQNYATILQSEDLSDEERRLYAARIGEASERLTVLVTDILQLSRLENQKIKPKAAPFNLSEALARCILVYDAQLAEKGIELEVELDEDIVVESDEALLDRVWSNLLSNAVKFTPEGGCILVRAGRVGERTQIEVADTGFGMDEATLRHVFDKFYQGDTSHATEGNGLGLALVRRIVELLGGQITVESTLGEGSTFTVLL